MNSLAVLQSISPAASIDMLSSMRDIYESSFPTDERRYFESVLDLIKKDSEFEFYAVMRNGKPVGLFSSWHLGNFMFIEHFAISEKYRGWGIGQQILETWLAEQSLPVILETERPEDDLTRRRIEFYERAGFRIWSTDYLQPAYSFDKNPVPLLLMVHGDIDSNETLDGVRHVLYQKVYATALPPS